MPGGNGSPRPDVEGVGPTDGEGRAGALAPYRVLDLTTDRGWLCGRLLADLGADVVKVEPPGGDPGRRVGPFDGDRPDPERNLRWWFLNRGKRSVTVDLDEPDGREVLRRLVATADVVVESFPPGRLEGWGLGPSELLAEHPSLVVTSITPFGRTGPRAGHRGPDLVLAATGGPMWLTGDPDRPPVRVSVPQADLHAGAEAAVHTVVALHHAARTGAGQHVDVATQLCVVRTLMNATSFPLLMGRDLAREGQWGSSGPVRVPRQLPCADGHVTVLMGATGMSAAGTKGLLAWIAEDEPLPAWLEARGWRDLDLSEVAHGEDGQAFFDGVVEVVAARLRSRTKAELYAAALERRLLLAPVNTVADIRADVQLAARQFFVDVDEDGLGPVPEPGPWARLTTTPLAPPRRAPHVGEHTATVLVEPRRRSTAPPPPPARPVAPDDGVFAGLRVWDMSWVGVGPMTARYLADHGATVVRLDSSSRPDTLRQAPPWAGGVPGLNRSQFYADFNAGKLGVGIDMDHPRGRDVALRLVDWADVVLESFTPKTMAAWGMGWPQLRERKPSLVMLSTCMQGQTGPRAAYRGFGNLMASLAGFTHVTGWPDRPPSPVYGAYTDFICQRFAALALVAAVHHGRRTGEGQHIDVSQFEAALHFLGIELLDLEVNGRVAGRHGNASPVACPHGAYPCLPEDGRERWVAVAVEGDEEWAALRRSMGDPAWAADPALATPAGRAASADEIDRRLGEWTARWRAGDLVAHLQPEVAAGLVQTQSDLHADPQVRHRGYFEVLEHPEMGAVPYDGLQARLSRTPGRLRRPAPRVGEHTVAVLTDVLGLDPDEVAELVAEGAVEVAEPIAPIAAG